MQTQQGQSKSNNHADRAHARLSASSAERWMRCTPSVALMEQMPAQKENDFMLEGTLAHELAELGLKERTIQDYQNSPEWQEAIHNITETCIAKGFDGKDMQHHVDNYVEYVMDILEAAKLEDPLATLLIEERANLGEWIPEGFGTNDAIVIANGTMHVIDLKYGRGVEVSAEDNSQLKLYALGAYRANEIAYDGITDVTLHIVQPRLNNFSSWTLPLSELLRWGEEEVKPKAIKAMAGEGEPCAGKHCKFCTVKPRCRAAKEYAMQPIPTAHTDPKLLSTDELQEVLAKADFIGDFVKSCEDYALAGLLDGTLVLPNYKVVEGRSVRKWVDEKQAMEVLAEDYPREEFTTTKLKGIGDIEKLVGKKNFPELLGTLVEKPQGKPSLAPSSSPKPAFEKISAKDFE